MEIKQLHVHTGPISVPCSRHVLPKGLIVRQPDLTGKVLVSAKDEQLVLHQILPLMQEMVNQDQGEDGKCFRPSRDVNMTVGFLRPVKLTPKGHPTRAEVRDP